MSDLVERLDAWLKNMVTMGSPEFIKDWAAGVDLIGECRDALSVAPAPVAGEPFNDEFSEEAFNEIAESAQKLSFALGRGEIDGDDSGAYLVCRFLDEIAECVTNAGIKWNDEDGSLHVPAPPVQEGPAAIDASGRLALREAVERFTESAEEWDALAAGELDERARDQAIRGAAEDRHTAAVLERLLAGN